MKYFSKPSLFIFIGIFALLAISTGFTYRKLSTPPSIVRWSAQDSTIVDKQNATVSLYGKARFTCDKFSLSADEIVYSKKLHKVIAKNFVVIDGENKDNKGAYGEFLIKD